MENKIIDEAIDNIVFTSAALEKFCNESENYNAPGSEILEQMSWDLYKQANDLREIRYLLGL